MKYTSLSLLLLTVSTGSAFATQTAVPEMCQLLSEFDCQMVNDAATPQQRHDFDAMIATEASNTALAKALDEKITSIKEEAEQFTKTQYQKACNLVLSKYPMLQDCPVRISDITDTLPLRAWQFDNIPVTDPKTHTRINVDLPALVQEIENLRLENLQHPKQAVEENDRERFELNKRISEEQNQKYELVRQIRLNVQSHQREALRKLAHLTEDDYIIPFFPCSAHTPNGQATRCFSSSHHLYGITAFVSVSEQSNQMAAVYFPVGDGEVEDAYNNSQSDHAARWMADSADMHGDPVQAERMREHIGVMSFTLAGVGNNPHIFMNQDKR
ncbi:hypothetical protein JGW18_000298 [Salmonella enterica]|nr:hypothetical protein [Salmonella enterica]ECC1573914.1 hypothetical protein [Salmonella enterica subsp. diarizonae]ECO7559544.1 hypothetical protein [Salmonella enterica]EDJ9765787.1 hypothetical protein [Salmonella enterica]EEE1922288.1 hypothetical protein [Salmonella enterica subsp. diarizonae]